MEVVDEVFLLVQCNFCPPPALVPTHLLSKHLATSHLALLFHCAPCGARFSEYCEVIKHVEVQHDVVEGYKVQPISSSSS